METSAKIAVTTGAGSGIGRATALALCADGFSVVLVGRRRAMLEETAALAKARPPRMLAVPTDFTDPAAVASLFDTVKATYGRIDLLFNNAAISTRNIPIEDLTLEQWSDVVAVNVTGSFLCAQHAFRMMKSQEPRGGRIINNGLVSAHVPRRNSNPYAATKHALTGLTRSLPLDGRPYDIACGQIDIGNAATSRNEDTAQGRLQASGKVEAEARIDVPPCDAPRRQCCEIWSERCRNLDPQAERVVLVVEDEGPGIPRSERQKVFEPFFKIEGSRDPDAGGVGFGLAVTRSIIWEHGGDISLCHSQGRRFELPNGPGPSSRRIRKRSG